MTHVCGRCQYFPGGRFVADARVSHPGKDEYVRSIGSWDVVDGVFVESVDRASSPRMNPPPLRRRVVSIDHRAMIVTTASHPRGPRTEFIATRFAFSKGSSSLGDFDRGEFLAQAKQLGIRGFLPVPVDYQGKSYNAWRVESRVLKAFEHAVPDSTRARSSE
jgi:hypothetical protein